MSWNDAIGHLEILLRYRRARDQDVSLNFKVPRGVFANRIPQTRRHNRGAAIEGILMQRGLMVK